MKNVYFTEIEMIQSVDSINNYCSYIKIETFYFKIVLSTFSYTVIKVILG